MRIRRIRLVLPPRLRADAAGTARLAATQLAGLIDTHSDAPAKLGVTIGGNGQNAPLLARSIAVAVAGKLGGRS